MIILMAAMLRLFVSPKLEEIARRNAENAAPGHQHHMAGSQMSMKERVRSADAWSDVAHNFRGDWQMLWKEIVIGFLLAGYIALLGQDFFNGLFLVGETGFWPTLWNVIVGPLIAVASFVCSIGNIPLAAVLWSGGISFAGVLAFIFADLIVFPIIIAYRKYYGWSFALRITALMFVTMVIAALAIDGLFSLADIIPTDRPSTEEVFGHIEADYRMWLNGIALIVFAILIALTVRRGATDPVCGMKVDKSKGVAVRTDSGTVYFCSEHCRHQFEAEPEKYSSA
ncbi:MAG: permease, partial [bacterium]